MLCIPILQGSGTSHFLNFRLSAYKYPLDFASASDAKDIYDSLFTKITTVQLATTNKTGEQNASYAPFIRDTSGDLYIFVSGLAKHTQNLLETHQATVLIIEDEQDCRQIFARNRISYQCVVSEVSKDDKSYNALLDQMQDTFCSTLGLLRSLADFKPTETTTNIWSNSHRVWTSLSFNTINIAHLFDKSIECITINPV